MVNVSVRSLMTDMLHLSLTMKLAVWKRPNFWWSPSISRSLDAALDVSALQPQDIDLYDFYS
jgi:hypothetical protein